ncbi:hypothetical protein CONPUDRAFT_76078 [Coniophora puteana RWD-64-598 SS2]|uniref:Uncharacterized protein n=1 Tax=Coniophora puteana (strain RWD-64-598) TaxID=741705 RepID=A0A5M3MDW6_CONPW|nr:uncharacterized protein CONPUDRAFT_76078 [Coniophora puteana RWD-64-598 SS2]EIW77323.1 hypothetical protein CONPUDRAFT_76078 [Coniophora puteana RWD-64-598 SS2]
MSQMLHSASLVYPGFCRCLITAGMTALDKRGSYAYAVDERYRVSLADEVGLALKVKTIGLFSITDLSDERKLELASDVLFVAADALGNFFAVTRVFLLWDKNQRKLFYLMLGALMTAGCNSAFLVYFYKTIANRQRWISLPGVHSSFGRSKRPGHTKNAQLPDTYGSSQTGSRILGGKKVLYLCEVKLTGIPQTTLVLRLINIVLGVVSAFPTQEQHGRNWGNIRGGIAVSE